MTEVSFTAHGEADTDRLGAALAEVLPSGTTIALYGTLGAGKTRLTQAIAAASGIPRTDVMSPTFVLCHEYHGRRTIYHLDAYRIADDDEFLELGAEEYFESQGITIVEWADRVADCLPAARLDIAIEIAGDQARSFRIAATGDDLHASLSRLGHVLGHT